MSIILDTSVWIEYFKGRDKYFDVCQHLIENGQVFTLEIIFAELLQGAINKREIEILKTYYELIPQININQLYLMSGEFSRKEKLMAKGIGLIDSCIITATIEMNFKLWTLDKKIIPFLNKQYIFSPE